MLQVLYNVKKYFLGISYLTMDACRSILNTPTWLKYFYVCFTTYY